MGRERAGLAASPLPLVLVPPNRLSLTCCPSFSSPRVAYDVKSAPCPELPSRD